MALDPLGIHIPDHATCSGLSLRRRPSPGPTSQISLPNRSPPDPLRTSPNHDLHLVPTTSPPISLAASIKARMAQW